jgi:hypothetical protein
VGLAAAGAFEDLGPLVLGDHALQLHQQRVFGAVAAWAFEEHHRCACLGELLDQQRLGGVLARQRLALAQLARETNGPVRVVPLAHNWPDR